MKTKKLTKKLALNKSTVAHLNNSEKKSIKGGCAYTYISACDTRTECLSLPPAYICPSTPGNICATPPTDSGDPCCTN